MQWLAQPASIQGDAGLIPNHGTCFFFFIKKGAVSSRNVISICVGVSVAQWLGNRTDNQQSNQLKADVTDGQVKLKLALINLFACASA